MSITIFDGSHFKGKKNTLKAGIYPTLNKDTHPVFPNADTIPSLGIDKLGSIKVKPGTYAELFITQGFRDGSFVLFAGDYPSLGSANNKVDAIKVFDHDPIMFPIIEFYSGANFTGFRQNLAGTGQVTNFDSPFIQHDIFSSVKIPEGVTLTLFEHSGRKGRSLTLKAGDYPDLRIYNFNNIVSSVQIRQDNLEVTNIEYVTQVSNAGEPILIESIAQNSSSLQQQVNLTLERSYEESFTRSFSKSSLFGLEISRTTTVGVELGAVSASVSQTITANFEQTFTFGKEETKSKTITASKGLVVNIPPGKIAKATMTLTPQTSTIEAIYTLRLIGTHRTSTQTVTIEIKSASVGTVVIDNFTDVEK